MLYAFKHLVVNIVNNPTNLHFCVGDQIHILLCYTAISKDNWLAALRDILDIKFFNSNWTKKISEDIEGHLNNTSDTAQSYYAYDLETLYADAIKDEPDAPSNIEYTNNTNEIACATLNKLLLKLAHPTEQDNTFLYTFMLTYKSFISTEDLLEFLIRRWYSIYFCVMLLIYLGIPHHLMTAISKFSRESSCFQFVFVSFRY